MGKILKSRFIYPFRYRPNVACFLYKKEGGKIKILLVERRDVDNHWQIPQGGTDGEDLKTAGGRELFEETGVKNLIVKAVFPSLHKYLFPKKPAPYGSKFYKYDYKGQKQGLYIAEFLGDDSEIKINFWDHQAWQWVETDKALDVLDPVRREAFKIYLEKFKSLNL
jgi:8-oxo-dGTP pyrophosphatase MutT (NUDIX family)